MSILILGVCSYCYLRTILMIRDVIKQVSAVESTPKDSGFEGRHQSTAVNSTMDNKSMSIEAKVTKKVMGYILKEGAWVYALVAASINMGPIGNAICYVINEGWGLHGNNSSINETKNSSTTALSSNAKNISGINYQDIEDDFNNSIPLQDRSTITELSREIAANSDDDREDFGV
ncbi:16970_t:CDS:2 [Acaulospora colombiana]|uniref:16970_t:CDS:1 n=1 Tax=Acaulospora colombiana TaxID=27376 RepID=A0ACA9K5N1_9GLOM|nr:16970_t:CDS:2 [Acaulospora colombiana]